jgi:hypothetical protein
LSPASSSPSSARFFRFWVRAEEEEEEVASGEEEEEGSFASSQASSQKAKASSARDGGEGPLPSDGGGRSAGGEGGRSGSRRRSRSLLSFLIFFFSSSHLLRVFYPLYICFSAKKSMTELLSGFFWPLGAVFGGGEREVGKWERKNKQNYLCFAKSTFDLKEGLSSSTGKNSDCSSNLISISTMNSAPSWRQQKRNLIGCTRGEIREEEKETSKRGKAGSLSSDVLLSERRLPRDKSALPVAQAKLILKQFQTRQVLWVEGQGAEVE